MKYILAIVFSSFCLLTFGQVNTKELKKETSKVMIRLDNGSRLYGELLTYKPGDKIIMRINGAKVEFPDAKIKKIVMFDEQGSRNMGKMKTHKFYHATSAHAIVNNDVGGLGVSYSLMYLFHHRLGVGLSVGLDNYYAALGRNVYPVLLEAKTYFMDRNSSPFVSLKTGYGFIKQRDNLGQFKVRGGFVFNPKFGYRFGSSGLIFEGALGLRTQSAYYEFFRNDSRHKQDIVWKRIEISGSIMF